MKIREILLLRLYCSMGSRTSLALNVNRRNRQFKYESMYVQGGSLNSGYLLRRRDIYLLFLKSEFFLKQNSEFTITKNKAPLSSQTSAIIRSPHTRQSSTKFENVLFFSLCIIGRFHAACVGNFYEANRKILYKTWLERLRGAENYNTENNGRFGTDNIIAKCVIQINVDRSFCETLWLL